MRNNGFNPNTTAFQTRRWRNLYGSFTLDLDSLKTAADSGASFVCIDAEPCGTHTSKPAEIGISFLSNLWEPKVCASSNAPVASLDAFSNLGGLETHWIRISGREREGKHRQRHRYGHEHMCEAHEAGQLMLDLIQRLRQKPSNQDDRASLILTFFSHTFEFRMLSVQYPEVLSAGVFTSWLDLQAVAAEASVKGSKLIVPSLQETLVACGIEERFMSKHKAQHNSATDTVRIAALVSFFVKMDTGRELDIKCASQKTPRRMHRQDPTTKKNWNCRPSPSELFPYTVKIWQASSLSKLVSAEALRRIFDDYERVAVGLHKVKRHGWICLADLASLEEFVRHVNDSIVDGMEGTWFAASLYDPTVTPVRDMSELKAIRKQAVHALADGKLQEHRRLKRESACALRAEGRDPNSSLG